MSLTDTDHVFLGAHESAVNDLLQAFYIDRPRLFAYGSPVFVPSTTVTETAMDAIPFPGVPGGIGWRVRLVDPRVDLFDQDDPLPPELSLDPGRFSLRTGVELCLECRKFRVDRRPPRRTGRDGSHQRGNDHDGHGRQRDDEHHRGEPTCCRLDVVVVGHLTPVLTTTGEDAVALEVDAVEVVDIRPDDLEQVVECLLFMVLQAVLSTVRIPLDALRAGAFELTVNHGPLIEDDQIKARGSF